MKLAITVAPIPMFYHFREEGQSPGTAKPLRSLAMPGLPGLLVCLFVSPKPVTIQYLPINMTWAFGGPSPAHYTGCSWERMTAEVSVKSVLTIRAI